MKTGAFYTKYQQKNGAFYYKNNLDGSSDPFSVSGSTTAFVGILWLRLKQYGAGDAFQENIQRSVGWVLESRYPKNHPDKNLAGGFFEVQQKSGGGKLRIYQRDIATSFCIRFLCDYYDDLSKQKGSTP